MDEHLSTEAASGARVAFVGLNSAIAFVEQHRRYFDRDADGVVDTYTEWRGSTDPSATTLVYSLSIVCPGHYAFERDGDSLAHLWAEAGAYYATPESVYSNGCDGSCMTASAPTTSGTGSSAPVRE